MTQERESYKYAEVKWNSGRGALLCNGCRVILATGFDHVDKLHFCSRCEERQSQNQEGD